MIKLKDISFEICPFRTYDEVYGNIIEYCSLNPDDLCSCDIEYDDLSENCPLFEKVDE